MCVCVWQLAVPEFSAAFPLQKDGFHPEYFTSGNMIVSATMDIYKQAMQNLLPTPAKSHYVFNLRDFARVVLGCLLVKPQSVDSKKLFVRLWMHEVYRVYYDRLIDDVDRQWLFKLLQDKVKLHFKEDFQSSFKHLASSSGGMVTDDNMRSLLFGDYLKPDAVS